jgi:hypothetical protein
VSATPPSIAIAAAPCLGVRRLCAGCRSDWAVSSTQLSGLKIQSETGFLYTSIRSQRESVRRIFIALSTSREWARRRRLVHTARGECAGECPTSALVGQVMV